MPRGHEHISFVFSSAFRDIFSLSFLRIRFVMGKRSLCRGGCNNDRLFPVKY